MSIYIPKVTLYDGTNLPTLGFGTAGLKGGEGVKAIEHAISLGYRLIDTAYNYENEGAVGKAIKNCGIPRDELIITSKLPGRYHKREQALIAIEESLYRLGIDYLDLYLIHWPNPIQDDYVEAWKTLIEAKKRGWIRSIGVCNFLPEHINRLEKETGVLPSVNQIELHPYFNQEEQRKYHREKHIQTQSWSPLVRTNEIFQNEQLQQIAHSHAKSVVQVILRWHYQLGSVTIPKSANPEHQKDNMNIFDFKLTENQMEKINQLSKPDGRMKNQDPAVYEEF